MPNGKQYMRPGLHNGIAFGVELLEYAPGHFVVDVIYVWPLMSGIVDPLPGRQFGDIDEAFDAGAAAARIRIELRAEGASRSRRRSSGIPAAGDGGAMPCC